MGRVMRNPFILTCSPTTEDTVQPVLLLYWKSHVESEDPNQNARIHVKTISFDAVAICAISRYEGLKFGKFR